MSNSTLSVTGYFEYIINISSRVSYSVYVSIFRGILLGYYADGMPVNFIQLSFYLSKFRRKNVFSQVETSL